MTLAELERAWARSDLLFSIVPPERWAETRGIPLRHPVAFYVGHLPAFAWNHVGVAVGGRPPLDPALDVLFERGIDPEDERAAARATTDRWPEPERIVAYRDRVRAAVREVLPEVERGGDDPMRRWVGPMVLEHERMHHETLLYQLARLEPDQLALPTGWTDRTGDAPEPREVVVDGGPVAIGGDRAAQPFGWCCEFPRRTEDVATFAIDAYPVTVGRYLPFVEAGGYADPRWWTADDRAWIERIGLRHPDGWRREGGRWTVRSLGARRALDDVSGWPVQVSLAEARAYARWAGRRLPTEAELHRAAYTGPAGEDRAYPWGDAPPSAERGAFDFHVRGWVPVGSYPAGRSAWGVEELVGNGWEWTTTPFVRWPGFEAHLRSYPGYSTDFFDGRHFVVFGGSWCTDRRLLRRTFRNWYQHHYPYVFATFRTVAA